jgi:hypothetical protein
MVILVCEFIQTVYVRCGRVYLGHLDLFVPDDLLEYVAGEGFVGAGALGGVTWAAAAADADALRGGDGVDGLAALTSRHAPLHPSAPPPLQRHAPATAPPAVRWRRSSRPKPAR